MSMAVVVVIVMVVVVRMLRLSGGGRGDNTRVGLELLHAAGMQRSGVRTGGLGTGVREELDDRLEVLLGTFRGAGESEDDRLIADSSHWPRHHCKGRHLQRGSQHAMY
jgi:hypothetical protein